MDIGQPKDFIIGTGLYLEHLKQAHPERLASGESFVGNVLVVGKVLIVLGQSCQVLLSVWIKGL